MTGMTPIYAAAMVAGGGTQGSAELEIASCVLIVLLAFVCYYFWPK